MKRVGPALFLLTFIAGIFANGCSGVRPANLGLHDGKLAPCPDTPNCVSSHAADKVHFIEPLPYAATATESLARIKSIITGMKRAAIISETDKYVHAEFTSAIWRFVDDVEFALDENSWQVHIRSASRIGRSDMGVNRKRVEEIRSRWHEAADKVSLQDR